MIEYQKITYFAHSSTETKYRAIATTAAKLAWLCSLHTELSVKPFSQPVIL